MTDEPIPPDVTRKRLRWAALQFVLGQAQMIGAAVGVYLLITTGVSHLTLAVVAGTATFTLVSKLIFRGRSAADMVPWPRPGPETDRTGVQPKCPDR